MAEKTGGGMIAWLEANPTLSLAGGIVIVLIIAGQLIKPKTPATSTPNADLSGLKNGLVYVPTQTTFTTINKQQQGVFASNDPNLTSITSGPIGNPTTTTQTVNPPPTGGGDNDRTCRPGYHWQAAHSTIRGSYAKGGGYCVPNIVPTPTPTPVPPPVHRSPPPPPPTPVAKYPIPGKSPFVYRFGEKSFQWKDPYGKLWTVGFGPSGRVWGVPGSVSDTVWQHTPIPPKTLLYQD